MESTKTNSKEDGVSKEIPKQKHVDIFEKHKRQVAAYLGKQSEKLSALQRKWSLLTFGIIMGGFCLLMMIRPFQQNETHVFVIPEGMESSVVIKKPFNDEPILSPTDYQMLQSFKRTLDSLYKSDRPMYEELLRDHEGLLDSINFLMRLVH